MTEVLILANSYKVGGRCVAGVVLDTLEWVRPVGHGTDRELTVGQSSVVVNDERLPVKPGDVVDMTIGERCPTPYHPEDVAYIPGWTYLGSMEASQVAEQTLPIIATSGHTLGWIGKDLDPSNIVEGYEHPSLELRLVENLALRRDNFNAQKLVAIVDNLRLKVSDPAIDTATMDGVTVPSALITVSLSEPFLPTGGTRKSCYKLVATLLAL